MFDAMKFLGGLLTGAASATGVHLVGQMVPGSAPLKIGAQVATTAAVTGALHVGGAPEHIRDAAAVGGGAALAVRVADELAVYQAVAKLREGSGANSNANSNNAGANGNNPGGPSQSNNPPTSGLNGGRRGSAFNEQRSRAYA